MVRAMLTVEQRRELEARVRSRNLRAGDVRKARLVLMLAEGFSYRAVQDALGCSSAYVARWKTRFEAEGLAGLYGRHQGRRATVLTPAMEARILAKTRTAPKDGSTHWSTRRLAKALGVNHTLVARVWARAGIKPHRMARYMASDDPEFESKAADIIALYLKPPQHAAVFCLDEKTAIQALDRLDPVLPMSPGRLERHGFEYYRHGTLSLYAALNATSGQVLGRTAARHTSEEFVAFLGDVVASQPVGREIHVILDNLSTHKTARVRAFLNDHPDVHLHFTPTYSSWLNQVEIWFSKIDRDVIARGVFTSTKDLARKLLRYIRAYNRHPKPIKWRYSTPTHRIQPASISTGTGH
ncbi:MAG TPA: IS630 family transposase [Thermoanaerobaculaceae bacterium]|nr:IS630 family transposase [Thermoanaerobaculaceae bacterium]